jgi:hypothetical protein
VTRSATRTRLTVGVSVGYPLGQTAAKVQAAQTQIQIDQQQMNLIQELQIISRSATPRVRSSPGPPRIHTGGAHRQRTAARRRAQEKSGCPRSSTSSSAPAGERQIAELTARIAYNRALINFERVQRIR